MTLDEVLGRLRSFGVLDRVTKVAHGDLLLEFAAGEPRTVTLEMPADRADGNEARKISREEEYAEVQATLYAAAGGSIPAVE